MTLHHPVWTRLAVVAGVAWVAVLVAIGGDATAQSAGGHANLKKNAPQVSVAEIVQRTIPVERTYTGTTAAVKAVELRAQVTGYLMERKFIEGSDVKEGETLYLIDPRPFQAVLDEKEAALREQQAILEYASASEKRYAAASRVGAAAQERRDQAIELQAKTKAAIDVYKAEIKQAQINLDFTEVKAPFDGRIGRTLVNIGGLVKASETPLASFVRLDPIYVYFSPPETELLLIEARQKNARLKVTVTLPHASAEEFKGTLDFIGNTADERTGTITMRATIDNPGQRLRAGQFALVRLRIADDTDAVVVPAKAISSVQGQRFVMVVGKDNKLERRHVNLGRQVGAEGYVVEAGLSGGELVVISDIQTLKAGEAVSPRREPAS